MMYTLKSWWQGWSNVGIAISWVVTNWATKKIKKEAYEHAVKALATRLLDDGVIKVTKRLVIDYDGELYRASIDANFNELENADEKTR